MRGSCFCCLLICGDPGFALIEHFGRGEVFTLEVLFLNFEDTVKAQLHVMAPKTNNLLVTGIEKASEALLALSAASL